MKLENNKIAILGLGYVGLPLAIAFSRKYEIIGFDINQKRIAELKEGFDNTREIEKQELTSSNNISYTSKISVLKDANIFIITVPTPVDKNNTPDLNPLKDASKSVASVLDKGNIVIFESTVFPGCTEEICAPILEKYSGLTFNIDFFCGYSPERINPGDTINRITNIKKVTSGSTPEISNLIDDLYKSIITAGTFKVSSIRVAEAAKVIENTQRDVNIALVNELSLIFNKLDIDTTEVLNAASTKWNFMPFKPGLVGGHCIGVDPYYLTYKAAEVGYHPEMILAGRRINDNMGPFIADNAIAKLAESGVSPIGAKVCIMGLTFKENCPDLRNTKIITIIKKLRDYKCNITVSDDWADSEEAYRIFQTKPKNAQEIYMQDALIIAVSHNEYKDLNESILRQILKPNGIFIDVKSLYDKKYINGLGFSYWSL